MTWCVIIEAHVLQNQNGVFNKNDYWWKRYS